MAVLILFHVKDVSPTHSCTMPVTRSQSGKLPRKDGKKNPAGGKDPKPKRLKVTEPAGEKEKPGNRKKDEHATEREDGKVHGGVPDDPFSLYSKGLLAENDPRGPNLEPRMPEIPSSWNPLANYLQFHPAKTLGQRDWPRIYFGEFAPKPRWRLSPGTTNPEDFGRDNTKDLIKKATGKWDVKGVRPADDPKFDKSIHKLPLSYDHQIGLAALDWTFEEGDERDWKGLNQDQLREYAFRCLWETIQSTFYTQQIANHIRRDLYRDAVKHTSVPVPLLPDPPKEGNFPGLENNVIGKLPPSMTQATGHFANDPYERDSLAIRVGRTDDDLHPLTRRIFESRRERIRNAPSIPAEYDDTSSEDENDDPHTGKPAESGECKCS